MLVDVLGPRITSVGKIGSVLALMGPSHYDLVILLMFWVEG